MCKHHPLQADLVTHIHLQHHAGGVAVDSITAHQVHKAIQAPARCLIRAVSCGLFRPRKLKLSRIAKTYRPPKSVARRTRSQSLLSPGCGTKLEKGGCGAPHTACGRGTMIQPRSATPRAVGVAVCVAVALLLVHPMNCASVAATTDVPPGDSAGDTLRVFVLPHSHDDVGTDPAVALPTFTRPSYAGFADRRAVAAALPVFQDGRRHHQNTTTTL